MGLIYVLEPVAKAQVHLVKYDVASALSFVFYRTPLHEAVASGNEPVFSQLLECKQ